MHEPSNKLLPRQGVGEYFLRTRFRRSTGPPQLPLALIHKPWESPLPTASNPRVRDAQGSEPKPRLLLSPQRRGYERHHKSRDPKKEKKSQNCAVQQSPFNISILEVLQ